MKGYREAFGLPSRKPKIRNKTPSQAAKREKSAQKEPKHPHRKGLFRWLVPSHSPEQEHVERHRRKHLAHHEEQSTINQEWWDEQDRLRWFDE